MNTELFMKNLLSLYPYWQYDMIKPLTQYNKKANGCMSLENYYLLQIIRWFGGLTMTEVARHITTTKQQATLKVDKMCEGGYLERISDDNDRRIIKVVVTGRAIKELDAYHDNMKGFMKELRGKLSEEDLEELNRAMEQMLKVLPKLK